MRVIVNGEEKTFEAPLNLYDVLEQQDMIHMMIAVAHNGNFIPKGDYAQIFLNEGDMIEIVAPMQGG